MVSSIMGSPSSYRTWLAESFFAILFALWFPVVVPSALICFFLLLFTPLFPLPLLYAVWFFYDRKTPFRQGRRFQYQRELVGWRHFANYFPASLHKTVDLDPNKGCYLMIHHPHAVIGIANFIHFGTDGTNSSKVFPGITFWPATLNANMYVPFLREWSLSLGMTSVSGEAISYKLTKMGNGQAVTLVVGGAAEAGLCDNDDPYKLKLQDRKGFVKVALKTGASMVPVFTFGEMDIFTVKKATPGSLFDKFQKCVYRNYYFWPVVFYGHLGICPYRKPMHTVVGSPIEVPKIAEPTNEDIDRYHQIYVEALTKLFDDHVAEYGDPTKELKIL